MPRFSYRSFTGLESQPVRRRRVNGRPLKIAEQGDAVEFQIRSVAVRTRRQKRLSKERASVQGRCSLPVRGSLHQADGFRSTAADSPSTREVTRVVLCIPECFSNTLPKNRIAMIAAKIGMPSVSMRAVPQSRSRGSCYRVCPDPHYS